MAVRVSVLFALLTAAPLVGQSAPAGAKAPEAAFEAARVAAGKGDYKALFAVVDPAAVDDLVAGYALAGTALRGVAVGPVEADLKARLEGVFAVLDKHGVTKSAVKKIVAEDEQKAKAAYRGLVQDKIAFLSEVLPAMAKSSAKAEAFGWAADAKLENLKAEGTTATADVVSKAGKEAIAFVKVGEAWFVKPTFKR